MFGSVDYRDLAFVFDVAIDASRRVIRYGELRTASERNGRGNHRRFRVDHSRRIALMIEHVELTAMRLVNERVGTFSRVDLRNGLECLQINDASFRFLAVRGKTALQLRHSDKAVNTGCVGNFADHSILVKIDNDDFRGVRQIESARCRVDCQNIPAAFAADRDLSQKFVWLLRDNRRLTERNQPKQQPQTSSTHSHCYSIFERSAPEPSESVLERSYSGTITSP